MSDGSYPGGKAGAGVSERLISAVPRHSVKIVPFAGHCAMTRRMMPCHRTILCDRDPDVCRWWADRLPANTEVRNVDGIEFLRFLFALDVTSSPVAENGDGRLSPEAESAADITGCGVEVLGFDSSEAFIYGDPPYVLDTRKSGPRYLFEMDDFDHQRLHRTLLQIDRTSDAHIMLSGYDSPLHDVFRDWHHWTFEAMTRGGVATEHVWQNRVHASGTDSGVIRHDYRFFGKNSRDRFRLRRRSRNRAASLASMPPHERRHFLFELALTYPDDLPDQSLKSVWPDPDASIEDDDEAESDSAGTPNSVIPLPDQMELYR